MPMLLFNVVVLLFVFYRVDMRAYRHDIAEGRKPDISGPALRSISAACTTSSSC